MNKIAKLMFAASFLVPGSLAFADNETPTDIDSLFKGKEFQLPRLDSTYSSNYSDANNKATKGTEKEESGGGLYVLQFDAIADFDAAQSRRARLHSQTGYDIQMVFDAPFYKLRGGYFKKKSDAEDKARELSLYNISAFTVKVK